MGQGFRVRCVFSMVWSRKFTTDFAMAARAVAAAIFDAGEYRLDVYPSSCGSTTATNRSRKMLVLLDRDALKELVVSPAPGQLPPACVHIEGVAELLTPNKALENLGVACGPAWTTGLVVLIDGRETSIGPFLKKVRTKRHEMHR